MKTCASDSKFLLGLISAHIFIYITYQNTTVFWYLYTATILVFISFAITVEKSDSEQQNFLKNLLYGAVSGLILYLLFFVGEYLINVLNMNGLAKEVASLYKKFSPEMLWHYIVLFLLVIPGEEIFWRGFVQKKLMTRFSPFRTIIFSTALYTLPLLYSTNNALIMAGIAGGLMWSALYQWKKNLPAVIASHLVFDFLLIILLPFS
ncbi:MAG: lysostaphin resistance A-like protein [Bacillus sp. (in: firmicutes)]